MLEKAIKRFQVTTVPEYKSLPDANGLKELMTHMLALDHNERWDAETSLNFALEKWAGCHKTGVAPLCPDDPTKKVSELPACWAGDKNSEWKPEPTKKPVELPQPAPAVFDRQESLEEEKMKEEVSDIESVFFEGDNTEKKTIDPTIGLGMELEPDGTILNVDWGTEGHQLRDLGVKAGWILVMVAGDPFNPDTFDAAMNNGAPFEVVFKVPQDFGGQSINLDEEEEDDEQIENNGMKYSLKMFTVRRPGNTIATNYMFRKDYIGGDGVVQEKWASKESQKYVRAWPLRAGDQILKINDVHWTTSFDDRMWRINAKAGLLGELRIEYIRKSN